MTLRQGLKEYSERPLIDLSYMSGIEDTYRCAIEKNISFFEEEDIQRMATTEEHLSLLGWKKTLEMAIINPKTKGAIKEAWQYKLEHMIQEHLKELLNFMPWIELLEQVPLELYSYQLEDQGSEWVALLDLPPSMKTYSAHCAEICKKGELIIENP